MIQANRVALTACGQFGRVAAGALGIMVVIAAMGPTPEPGGRARPMPGDPEQPMETIEVTVPEGMVSKSLTIIDAAGRELATLTHWCTGETVVVTRRRGGPVVSCWLNREDRAVLDLIGSTRRTHVEMNPDGTTKTITVPRSYPNHQEPEEWDEIPATPRAS